MAGTVPCFPYMYFTCLTGAKEKTTPVCKDRKEKITLSFKKSATSPNFLRFLREKLAVINRKGRKGDNHDCTQRSQRKNRLTLKMSAASANLLRFLREKLAAINRKGDNHDCTQRSQSGILIEFRKNRSSLRPDIFADHKAQVPCVVSFPFQGVGESKAELEIVGKFKTIFNSKIRGKESFFRSIFRAGSE
jgi:hypothetical protein